MNNLTPETLAELRQLAEAATPGPWASGDPSFGEGNAQCIVSISERAMGRDIQGPNLRPALFDVEFIAAANPAVILTLLDTAAERDALAESVRTYGRTIDRWGLLIIAATHSEDITTPDGDGDWEVIESRLAEVPALLAERDALAAKVERARALATEWATQPTDYDEDTEQQIEDGNAILRALDATPETGRES